MAVGSDKVNVQVVIDYDTHGSAPIKEFDDAMGGVERRAGGLNSSFKGLGGTIAGAFTASVIIGVGAALLDATDSAGKFDKGVREIGTLMGGLTDGEIKRMKGELTALSVASGQAIEPLTKARYDIVSAGFGDAADSALLLEQSSRLAAAGVTEVSVTADLLTTTLNSYGLSAADAAGVSDDLFTVVRLGKTTMGELGSSMGQVLATAGPMGVSLDELGAALATTTALGQSTAIATTSINAAMMELSKPSKDMQAALRAVGVESDNLIKTGGGLAGALELVKKASDGSGIAVEKLVSREEALRAIFPLVSSGAEKFTENLAAMKDNAGASDAAFEQMADSADFLKGQAVQAFEAAKRAVGDAAIESGLYAEGLRVVKDVMNEVRILFGDTAAAADGASSDIGKALQSVRIAVGLTTDKVSGLYKEWIKFRDSVAEGLPESEYSRTVNRIASGKPSDNALIRWYAEATKGSANFQKALVAEQKATSAAAAWTKAHEEALAELRKTTKSGTDTTEQGTRTTKENTGAVEGNTKAHGGGASAVEKRRKAVEDAEREEREFRKALAEASVALQGGTDRTVTLTDASNRLTTARGQLNAMVQAGTGKAKDLEAATRELIDADREFRAQSDGLREALTKANEALKTGAERTLSVEDATRKREAAERDLKDLIVEFTAKNNAANGTIQQTKADEEALEKATRKLIDAKHDEAEAVEAAADAHHKTGQAIVSTVDAIGAAYENASGRSIAGLGALKTAVQSFADGETTKGILSVADAVGQMIGGKTGSAISGAASGAMAGAALGPIGAAVGGVLGFVGGILGADAAKKEEREAARAEGYSSMLEMALSGGGLTRDLMMAGGWMYDSVADYEVPYALAGKKAGSRLYADRGEEGMRNLLQELAVVDTMMQTIAAVTQSGVSVALDDIAAKYEYMITVSGDLAMAEEARFRETAYALLGISVDSLTSAFESAMGATSIEDGANALRVNVQNGLNASLRSIVIGQVMAGEIAVLDPIIKEVVDTVKSGVDLADSDVLARLGTATAAITDTLVPVFEGLYSVFDAAQMLPIADATAGSSSAISTTAVTASGSLVTSAPVISTGQADTVEEQLAEIRRLLEAMLKKPGVTGEYEQRVYSILDTVSSNGSSLKVRQV